MSSFDFLSKFENRNNFLKKIHFIFWFILSVQIIWFLIPTIKYGSSYGFIREPSEDPSVVLTFTIDFPSHFNFAKKAWLGQTTVAAGKSVYSVENHLKVTSDWAGLKVDRALPFGYSPTMLWVLAPLVPFSHAISFCLFNIIGLLAIWWLTHPSRCRWGVGMLLFFSPLSFYCFRLGQTALLTGAGLLFLAETTQRKNKAEDWQTALIAGITLWALTAKPPIALTAAAVLFGLRKWKPLSIAAVLTFVSTLIFTPWLGADWINDYLHLSKSYDQVSGGVAYAWSFVPSHMANLRSILSVDIGVTDDIASRISVIIWIISLLSVSVFGLRSGLSESALWSLGILCYLILFPHVSSTEVLQIAIIIALLARSAGRLHWREVLILITVLLIPFASPAVNPLVGIRLPLFIAEIFLFVLVVSTKYVSQSGITNKRNFEAVGK